MTLTPEQRVVERIINLMRGHSGHLGIRKLLIKRFKMPGQRCTKCGWFKELDDFPKWHRKRHWVCRECHREYQKEYRNGK